MIGLSPRRITVTEPDPPSVASYQSEVRQDDGITVIVHRDGLPPDPSGVTVLPVGDPGGYLNAHVADHPELLGTFCKVYYRQQGPTGALSDWQQAGDEGGHGSFKILEIPDGAASGIVTV